MRSRLEAGFAQILDAQNYRTEWQYEPRCYADTSGQYLPDFRFRLDNGEPCYAETKHESILNGGRPLDEALRKLRIIHASDPVTLFLAALGYRDGHHVVTAGFWREPEDPAWQVVLADRQGLELWHHDAADRARAALPIPDNVR